MHGRKCCVEFKLTFFSSVFFLGKTYFFKGDGYWKFDDYNMQVHHIEPKRSSEYWMGCPRGRKTKESFVTQTSDSSSASTTVLTHSIILVYFMSFLVLLKTTITTAR